MADCDKCRDTGWRLLPTVAPTDALPCDRCDTEPWTDTEAVLAAHGFGDEQPVTTSDRGDQ